MTARLTAELERQFPPASVWYGQHTMSWWAAVDVEVPVGDSSDHG